ncbi:uncharacterized protein LOC124120866 isoform X1 [Haliotis rufescens]|uniref:uncharacterized protein LOC124120866 isoform X1 n=1 Tax=Haliotis rufescens TaxID=6454 RepID=UPI00201EF1A3|nr:uncharacterized protein LOC124120866 isoform X1 [Haliotis rufescens]
METEIKQEDVEEDRPFKSRVASNTSDGAQMTRKDGHGKLAEVDDFIVVKTENEDIRISREVEQESGESGDGSNQSQGASASGDSGHIPSDVNVIRASDLPSERFYHNGKELDLGDVLTTMTGQQESTDVSEGEGEEEEEMEVEEEEGEEEIEKDDDEHDDDDEEEGEGVESCGKKKRVGKAAKKWKTSSSFDPKPQEQRFNMGGLTMKYLTDSQRKIVERLVESNINVFRTITSSVEQREKKMSLWRTIAREVNCEPSRREITPEELVTIWSKHLFLKHVYSRKSLIVTKESDARGNGGPTQVFKTLIAKRGAPQKNKKNMVPSVQDSRKGPSSQSRDLSEEEARVFDEQIAQFRKVFTTLHTVSDQKRSVKLKEVWSEITMKVNEVTKGPWRSVNELQRRWTMSLIKQKTSLSVGRQVHQLVGSESRETSETADLSEPPGDVPIKIEIDNAESQQSEIIHVVRNRDVETETTTATGTAPTAGTVSVPRRHQPHHREVVTGTDSDSSGEGPVTVKEEPLDDSISQPGIPHPHKDNMGSKGMAMRGRDVAYIQEQVKIHGKLFVDDTSRAAQAGVMKEITRTLNRKHNTSYTREHVTAVATDFIRKLSHVSKRKHSLDKEQSAKRIRIHKSKDVSVTKLPDK